MVNLNTAVLTQLSVHIVGNKATDDGPELSQRPVSLNADMTAVLQLFFTRPFTKKEQGFERFVHPSGLQYNNCYQMVQRLFMAGTDFHESSVELARLLFECSGSHFIKKGEFYTAFFKDVVYEGRNLDAAGLFKSESRERFMQVFNRGGDVDIAFDEGIDINKLDKGAIILNDAAAEGYRVLTVDNTNRHHDAQYWLTGFLGVEPASDSFHNTQNLLTITKNYITKGMGNDFEISRADQADYLNRSVNYFKEQEQFNEQDFAKDVFGHDSVISSFNQYKQQYLEEKNLELPEDFDISAAAVKRQSRIFRSVIKLDKNFHIYIHGNKEMVETGFDNRKGKKYYKLYFDEES